MLLWSLESHPSTRKLFALLLTGQLLYFTTDSSSLKTSPFLLSEMFFFCSSTKFLKATEKKKKGLEYQPSWDNTTKTFLCFILVNTCNVDNFSYYVLFYQVRVKTFIFYLDKRGKPLTWQNKNKNSREEFQELNKM